MLVPSQGAVGWRGCSRLPGGRGGGARRALQELTEELSVLQPESLKLGLLGTEGDESSSPARSRSCSSGGWHLPGLWLQGHQQNGLNKARPVQGSRGAVSAFQPKTTRRTRGKAWLIRARGQHPPRAGVGHPGGRGSAQGRRQEGRRQRFELPAAGWLGEGSGRGARPWAGCHPEGGNSEIAYLNFSLKERERKGSRSCDWQRSSHHI